MTFRILAGLAVFVSFAATAQAGLPCQKEYERTYKLSAESIFDRDKADEALASQDELTACMEAYEEKNGADAREDLTLKLSEIKL